MARAETALAGALSVETFVDPARSRGTSYRAANWIVLGRTTGRGPHAPTKQPTRSIKEVLGYPLTPDFRARLAEISQGADDLADRSAHG